MSTRPSRRPRFGTVLATAAMLGLSTMAAVASPAAANQQVTPMADGGIAATTCADELTETAGTPVDGSNWTMETGDNVNNHERQWYTNSTSNAVHDGQGNLVITARRENPGNYQCWYGRCEYTSARLNTSGKFSQAYGTFETRLKMSRGQGMWPAFWL